MIGSRETERVGSGFFAVVSGGLEGTPLLHRTSLPAKTSTHDSSVSAPSPREWRGDAVDLLNDAVDLAGIEVFPNLYPSL